MRYLIVLLLAGCATTEGSWSKSGATEHDLHMDRGQCTAQMEAAPVSLLLRKSMFPACMQGKGWYWSER
jgi:hypothetical protein